MKRKIEIDSFYDDSGEMYYILPSGYEDMWLLVSESPIDLTIRHISRTERGSILEAMEN